ncbi:MAG: VOC family protein [Bryobacterales bacterium]|nr:VOC family protein [Bryobacterales bacterium]
MISISTFLMFHGEQHGKAEDAMKLYTSVFANSAILSVDRWGPGEPGTPGFVKVARFSINGVQFMASDSAVDHNFNFTPSISMFVECESDAELQAAFDALSDGGMALMPLDNYGFSTRFGWLQDRYGVSWQLNLT